LSSAAGLAPDDPLVVGPRSFRSRLIVGTGKYASVEETERALAASGAELITVALRRVNLSERGEGSLGRLLTSGRYTLLPNTAGCYTADEAVRTLRLARELGVAELHQHVTDKGAALVALQRRLDVPAAHTLAMGDDVVDLALAAHAALFVAPANARTEVRARAEIVTAAAGGAGAVRELAERLLAARGLLSGLLARKAGPAVRTDE
jgi:hypothetical protein